MDFARLRFVPVIRVSFEKRRLQRGHVLELLDHVSMPFFKKFVRHGGLAYGKCAIAKDMSERTGKAELVLAGIQLSTSLNALKANIALGRL